MTRDDFMQSYVKIIDEKIYYPKYTFDSFDKESEEYTNLKIIKTAEEEYQDSLKQIDNCTPGPTDKERIMQLESDKAILAENVYQLASIMEIMLGGTESGQTEATTTDTTD